MSRKELAKKYFRAGRVMGLHQAGWSNMKIALNMCITTDIVESIYFNNLYIIQINLP